jgi:phosphatidylglycerophosphate synthase
VKTSVCCLMTVVAVVVCGMIGFWWTRSSTFPAGPFLWVQLGALGLATLFASVAALSVRSKGETLRPSRGRRLLVWLAIWGITLFLWGSVGGRNHHTPNGELAKDGLTWWTDGGILGYLTVTSRQPGPGAEWSHELSIHPWPLTGTVALSLAVVVVAVLKARRRKISNQGALAGAA